MVWRCYVRQHSQKSSSVLKTHLAMIILEFHQFSFLLFLKITLMKLKHSAYFKQIKLGATNNVLHLYSPLWLCCVPSQVALDYACEPRRENIIKPLLSSQCSSDLNKAFRSISSRSWIRSINVLTPRFSNFFFYSCLQPTFIEYFIFCQLFSSLPPPPV